jgi:hypothetical protein
LCRTVAREGAFYIESYRGYGRWEADSEPITYLTMYKGQSPPSIEVPPGAAARLMAQLDVSIGSGDSPVR